MSLIKYTDGTWIAQGTEENLCSIEDSIKQFNPAYLMFRTATKIWNNRGFEWKVRRPAFEETYRLAVRLQEELYLHAKRSDQARDDRAYGDSKGV